MPRTAGFPNHTVTLFELAFDFPLDVGVDGNLVQRRGVFGKSRMKRGKNGQPRFGSRLSPKLVRFYPKFNIERFRVELEVHAGLLRKHRVQSVRDLSTLAVKLVPAHLRFVVVRWESLLKYLVKRFGESGEDKYAAARTCGETSVRKLMRYLAGEGVFNPHRFLRDQRFNDEIKSAVRSWADRWADEMQSDVP